jgi:hypothetical protein
MHVIVWTKSIVREELNSRITTTCMERQLIHFVRRRTMAGQTRQRYQRYELGENAADRQPNMLRSLE